ncbi:MAG: bifunctional DNA-formamidopyrimidine glycosylase/DNA-(apurinic or apyrimidinic site) lyase [Actinomycetota bacterium]
MPELPEVETIRGQLEPKLLGATIIDAGSHWSSKFTPALDAVGSEFVAARRRGKYLIFDLDAGREDAGQGSAGQDDAGQDDAGHDAAGRADDERDDASLADLELIVHLGMTGRLAVHEADAELARPEALRDDEREPHLRAWWRLDDDRVLTFHDTRRFGRIHVVDAGEYRDIPTLHALGPEPWDPAFTGKHLAAFVKKSNRYLKTILLAQRAVAGVGNIYADEALWDARINPATRRLSRERADELVVAVQKALESGLTHGGTTLRDYVDSDGEQGGNQHELACYGRGGEPCFRCGDELRTRVLDARTTTYCPTCQAR